MQSITQIYYKIVNFKIKSKKFENLTIYKLRNCQILRRIEE